MELILYIVKLLFNILLGLVTVFIWLVGVFLIGMFYLIINMCLKGKSKGEMT